VTRGEAFLNTARLAFAAAALAAARSAARPAGPPPAGLWSKSLAAYNRLEHREALDAVRELLAREPDNPLYRRHEAAVLFGMGDYAGSAAAAERFLRTAPEPTQACPLIANAYRRLGDAPRFLDALRRCQDLNPRDVETAFNLAQGLEETGDLRRAAALFGRISSEGYLGALISLGRVRLKQGAPARALEISRAALAREPGNAAAHILAAQAAAAAGDLPAARRHLSRARALAPGHPEARRLEEALAAP
jgi:predicted Zn-dependent protease